MRIELQREMLNTILIDHSGFQTIITPKLCQLPVKQLRLKGRTNLRKGVQMNWWAEIGRREWVDWRGQLGNWGSISDFLVVEVWWSEISCLSVHFWVSSKCVKSLQLKVSWISIYHFGLWAVSVLVEWRLYILVSWTFSIMINFRALLELWNWRIASWRLRKLVFLKAPQWWSIICEWVIVLVSQNLVRWWYHLW